MKDGLIIKSHRIQEGQQKFDFGIIGSDISLAENFPRIYNNSNSTQVTTLEIGKWNNNMWYWNMG